MTKWWNNFSILYPFSATNNPTVVVFCPQAKRYAKTISPFPERCTGSGGVKRKKKYTSPRVYRNEIHGHHLGLVRLENVLRRFITVFWYCVTDSSYRSDWPCYLFASDTLTQMQPENSLHHDEYVKIIPSKSTTLEQNFPTTSHTVRPCNRLRANGF